VSQSRKESVTPRQADRISWLVSLLAIVLTSLIVATMDYRS